MCLASGFVRWWPTDNLFDLGNYAALATGLAMHAYAHCGGGRPLAEFGCVAYTVVVCARDVSNAAELKPRIWSFFVLILDAALIGDARQGVVLGIVAGAVIYMNVVIAEQTFSFGLFDAVHWDKGVVDVCSCADPPCRIAKAIAFEGATTMTVMFLGDFFVTRGFAVSMRKQMAMNRASIATCDELTQHLSRYEVEEATRVLESRSSGLPPQLRESYERLLRNLRAYRAYLPDQILLRDDEVAAVLAAPGEGLDEADVCVVFTDVQSSTALWEEYHQGMYEALQQHNAVLRSTAAAHDGYEVKTIGDAFMVAFSDVQLAVQFAVEAQRQLLATEWPLDLLQAPLCRGIDCSSAGGLLWKGLRVRIGMHCGPVRVERNPVTHRCDYFGPPVNVAARIESEIRCGGLIGVSEEVIKRGLGGSRTDELRIVVHPLGSRKLKGLPTEVEIFVLLPRELSERRNVLDEADTQVSDHSHSQRDSRSSSMRTPKAGAAAQSAALGSANSRLSLRLTESTATCAEVQTKLCSSDEIPAFLAAVALAADISQGTLQSVLSASCVVTWNAPRSCAGHAEQCAHFLSGQQQQCRGDVPRWAGAASGSVLSGNIDCGRKKVATVIGGCVEFARVLAAAAAQSAEARTVATEVVARYMDPVHRCGSVTVGSVPVPLWSSTLSHLTVADQPRLWGLHQEQARNSPVTFL
eukprot:TRINITY_DN2321_c0_g1_i2.p1 TRINITY_DN2321_c0_g1~~TRINITY_DN2321_c0_g1_i2.p1  ORF type:complete len:695 (+),score=153.67 TRINITY_DN2321_c0_g1_i2:1330-3414(+)